METSFAQDAERKLGMDQQAIRKVQQNQKIMLGMHRLERAETQGPGLVDQIINNWLHFTKRLLVKFHRAYKSNDRLLDLHLLHQNIYKFCLQVPALY